MIYLLKVFLFIIIGGIKMATEIYTWEKEDDDSYMVTRKGDNEKAKIKATKLFQLGTMLFVKNATWTLYASETVSSMLDCFEEEILTFCTFDKVVLYKKEDGWYFFFWDNIPFSKGFYLKAFFKQYIKKLCKSDTKIMSKGVIEGKIPYVETTEGKFLLYYTEFPEPCNYYIKVRKVESLIKGYIKLYRDSDTSFYVGELCAKYEFDMPKLFGPFDFYEDQGDGYFIFGKKGKSQQLMHLTEQFIGILIKGKNQEISRINIKLEYKGSPLTIWLVKEENTYLVKEENTRFIHIFNKRNNIIKLEINEDF